jgi:hypothetical protein
MVSEAREVLDARRMYLSFASSFTVTLALWLAIACVDQPAVETPPAARVITAWDPRSCTREHRVVVDLEDSDGVVASGSVPCQHGSLALDVRHFGIYYGRIYAWSLEPPQIRSIMPIRLAVDETLVRWFVKAPE